MDNTNIDHLITVLNNNGENVCAVVTQVIDDSRYKCLILRSANTGKLIVYTYTEYLSADPSEEPTWLFLHTLGPFDKVEDATVNAILKIYNLSSQGLLLDKVYAYEP